MSKSNPLPGVPWIESPFFQSIFDRDTDPVLFDIALQLHREGFAIIDLDEPEIDAMAERIQANLHHRYDWLGWSEKRAELRLQDAWRYDDDVRRLAANEQIMSLLERLYGRKAWPFQTLNFAVGSQQPYHTDTVHFSSSPERFMCGVWIPLEDVGLDQGPLIYYPGSHKWQIYNNEQIGYRHSEYFSSSQDVYQYVWERMVEESGIQPSRLEIKRGQALIWTANLLHGGDVHLDREKTRWSQVTHYYFDGCSYFTPMNSDVSLGVVGFRHPIDILTGEEKLNMYLDKPISDAWIAQTSVDGWDARTGEGPSAIAFDGAAYLIANPDVARAGDDPYHHWVRHGRAEGRRLRP